MYVLVTIDDDKDAFPIVIKIRHSGPKKDPVYMWEP
jgi:hypothetical protein